MQVVDANVLLYAVNERSANHETARSWLDGAFAERRTVGLAWTVLLAFLRLSTHNRVFPRPLSPIVAADVVERWLEQPSTVVIQAGQRHLALLASLLESVGTAGNLVNDAHLAALAIEHGADIVSFDRDFARFEGVRWQAPAPTA